MPAMWTSGLEQKTEKIERKKKINPFAVSEHYKLTTKSPNPDSIQQKRTAIP